MNDIDLSVKIGDMEWKNPITTASGTAGYGQELKDYFDPEIMGALTVKGLTVEPTDGNPTPRIAETTGGILNSIGLENPGLKKFLKGEIENLGEFELPVIVNISGYSVDEFEKLASGLASCEEISALEVNVSCPNIKGGGMAFGTDSELIYKITKKIKKIYPGTVIVKLSPNVTDIVEMAEAVQAGGADCVSLINTLRGMAIDIEERKPLLGNIFGGLSGPAIKPVALSMVYQVSKVIDIPILGMGGIMNGEDVLEFIMAGASAVAVGTATLIDPEAVPEILKEIENYMIDNDIEKIKDLIGEAHVKN